MSDKKDDGGGGGTRLADHKCYGLMVAAAYGVVSITITLFNKAVFNYYEFKFPLTLFVAQMLFSLTFVSAPFPSSLYQLPCTLPVRAANSSQTYSVWCAGWCWMPGMEAGSGSWEGGCLMGAQHVKRYGAQGVHLTCWAHNRLPFSKVSSLSSTVSPDPHLQWHVNFGPWRWDGGSTESQGSLRSST